MSEKVRKQIATHGGKNVAQAFLPVPCVAKYC